MIKEIRFIISVLSGIIGYIISYSITKSIIFSFIILWCAFSVFFIISILYDFMKHDSASTKKRVMEDDMNRTVSDTLVISASFASLIGVFYLSSIHMGGTIEVIQLVACLMCIILSWIMLQLIFMLKYAVIYYSSSDGGINFNSLDKPSFSDFAYLAFTIGMTYQVSDTNIQSTKIRKLILKHALISFVFGTSIIATSINLVVNI